MSDRGTLMFRAAAATTLGARPNNEDSGFAGSGLVAVADGIGGHASGEVASALTCRVIVEATARNMITGIDDCGDVIARAQVQLRRAVERRPATAGMATTLTFLALTNQQAILGHLGDSRAYRIRSGQLVQLSTDHTMLEELIKLHPDFTQASHLSSVVTRCVSHTEPLNPDIVPVEIEVGDRILLCTDGLSGVLTPFELLRHSMGTDPQQAASRLVQAAEAAGVRDNATCVVADVVLDDETPGPQDSSVGALAQPENLGLLDPHEFLIAHATSPWLRS